MAACPRGRLAFTLGGSRQGTLGSGGARRSLVQGFGLGLHRNRGRRGPGARGRSAFLSAELGWRAPSGCVAHSLLIDSNPTKQKLVRSVTSLCRELGMTVVGEGVETRAERNTLIECGCELLQGYLIARRCTGGYWPAKPSVAPRIHSRARMVGIEWLRRRRAPRRQLGAAHRLRSKAVFERHPGAQVACAARRGLASRCFGRESRRRRGGLALAMNL